MRAQSEPPDERGDPFASILDLGSESRGYRWWALAGTLLVHSVVVGVAATSLMELAEFARDVQADVRARLRTQYDFKFDRPHSKPDSQPPKPEPPPPRAVRLPTNAAPPPPPPAAEAPNLMALKPDPNAPVDLTGDGIVVGNSDVIQSGAWVSSKPSGAAPSSVKPHPSGTPGGTGTAPAPAQDLSRPAQLLTPELIQNCGFPPEAIAEQIEYGTVQLVVNVGADNGVGQITVLSESPAGAGFGQRARTCAARARFDAARDPQGRPIAQSVRVTVKFRPPQ